ncbi:MAG: hypothetical protein OMM_01484 [Candidatus Magnetoglobus multicellularis str. Araruama]|uniref:ORC1/DEAH AAA+ ATPase domain-containing protein n=1 Tax=Candidatus Magnetoglobus multicellularis str. Araruama TaxID=890399 RepID=A0A1V1PCT5_9BACT|nr:MAG: hypothetical protein OMM_01484 [Candidatus Magnetoglobus multicellularis str. Araruama]
MKIKELFNKSNFGNYEKQFHSFREKIEMRMKSKMNHISFSENMITFYLDLLNKNEIQIKNCLFIIIHIPYQFSPKKFGDLIESIQKFILKKGFSSKNSFIIISGDEENFYNFVKDAFSNSVVLGGDKFDEILELDKPIEKIIEKLKSSLSEVAVSPFNYLGPCNPELFVGRTRLINDILRSTQNAYAIAGGRRIGKTSLLLKLYNTVRMKNAMPYSTIYIDSSIFSSFDELALDIQRRISPRDYYKKTRHDFSLHDIISRFASMQNKRIMLLIDEADSIVSRSSISDANNFFKAIRSLSNQRIIKFVIAGYRKIFNLISDPTHPLYNLCEGVKLGMLNRQEVRHLISVPLHNLNIKLIEEEKIIKKINDFTGGHPSLVQFIGKKYSDQENGT